MVAQEATYVDNIRGMAYEKHIYNTYTLILLTLMFKIIYQMSEQENGYHWKIQNIAFNMILLIVMILNHEAAIFSFCCGSERVTCCTILGKPGLGTLGPLADVFPEN